MLQRPIYNSELIEIQLPLAGVGQNQAVKFPTINRLKDVWLMGFAVYPLTMVGVTQSGYANAGGLENITLNLQDQGGKGPFINFPANAANPLQNFGFGVDINPFFFDSSKSTLRFNAATGAFVTQSAIVINAFFLHKEQYDTLSQMGYFKASVTTM